MWKEKYIKRTFESVSFTKREAALQKIITFLVSKNRQQLELKAREIQSNLFLITSDDRGIRLLSHHVATCDSFGHLFARVCLFVCLVRVRGPLCIICACILLVDLSFSRSLYTPENKGNVYKSGGFHWVDALSWPQTRAGAVHLKMYALAHYFSSP